MSHDCSAHDAHRRFRLFYHRQCLFQVRLMHFPKLGTGTESGPAVGFRRSADLDSPHHNPDSSTSG